MPNQTLYDNFSQVRQYIDQEKPDLSSYVTKTELSNCGYVTSTDLPVIDESIVPKENNTYTLGDSSYMYNATYSTYLMNTSKAGFYASSDYAINMILNNGNRYFWDTEKFSAASNNTRSLGSTSLKWKSTYTSSLFTNTAYLQDTSYTKSIIPNETNTYTLGDSSYMYNATYTSKLYINSNTALTSDNIALFITTAGNLKFSFDVDSFHPYGSTYSGLLDLGTSSNKWNTTYTTNLYADNIHNLIWTGTSAEYAALSDYTTYQLYLIKNE